MAKVTVILLAVCIGSTTQETTMKCQSSGHTYNVGQMYTQRNCEHCSCEVKGPVCRIGVLCILGKREERAVEASTCVQNGVTYHVGDTFSDGCNTCMCDKWGPLCTAMFCGQQLGKRGSTCEYAGVSHALGDTFSTGCHYCVCEDTGPRCLSLPCGKRQTSKQTCKHDGKVYSDGEHYVESCKECTCTGDGWKCGSYWMCELGR
ncbi:kielin/chordin-like protein [Haliotis rufescens]|uniref:kielin/chordin-like protein n=1 Tax=Haliotis rufescens TaxID=6454 RepID=UPI001EB040BF|nr:kielin/chordin-like protein [Haliotis rufescens]